MRPIIKVQIYRDMAVFTSGAGQVQSNKYNIGEILGYYYFDVKRLYVTPLGRAIFTRL